VGRIAVKFASSNEHKLRELRALLPGWEIEPLGAELPEETGATFYENALAKALFARALADPDVSVLAEDSGLAVDGLGGRPGIRSARYAGPGASDRDNVGKLLDELAEVTADGREARYVSELVLVSPEARELRGTGTLDGRIAADSRGSEGFGYDPVFVPAGEDATVSELGDAWKREHSHRAASAAALLAALRGSGVEL
jgi:XTP/dITP diphosphohydrolase